MAARTFFKTAFFTSLLVNCFSQPAWSAPVKKTDSTTAKKADTQSKSESSPKPATKSEAVKTTDKKPAGATKAEEVPASKAESSKTQDRGNVEAGQHLYMSNCEVCHLIGRNLVNPEKEILHSKLIDNPEQLKEFLARKNGKMPPFVKLSQDPQKLKDLSEFLHYARKHPSEINKEQAPIPDKKTTGKELEKTK